MDGSSCRLVRAFFFNDTATTEISTLSLHDALPISGRELQGRLLYKGHVLDGDLREHYRNVLRTACHQLQSSVLPRSEEHTSELQSRQYLVCRLLLEKKKPPFHFRNTPGISLSLLHS